MSDTALLLLPDLSLILIGLALRRLTDWGDGFWAGAERLVYYVLFPALLFASVLRARFVFAEVAPFLLTGLAVLAAGIALGALARPVLRTPALQFASGVQCAFRFNSYVALAVAQRLEGDAGVALLAVLIGVAVPLANVAAVLPLARHARTGFVRELMRNPLIVATTTGLAFNLAGLTLPEPALATLSRLGQAAVAVGLMCVGAGLTLGGAGLAAGSRRFAAWITCVKLGALPMVALTVGPLLALPALPQRMALMFAAMPTASSAYVLAARMGGDGPLVAWLVSLSTLGAMIALPLWLTLG